MCCRCNDPQDNALSHGMSSEALGNVSDPNQKLIIRIPFDNLKDFWHASCSSIKPSRKATRRWHPKISIRQNVKLSLFKKVLKPNLCSTTLIEENRTKNHKMLKLLVLKSDRQAREKRTKKVQKRIKEKLSANLHAVAIHWIVFRLHYATVCITSELLRKNQEISSVLWKENWKLDWFDV